RKNQMQDLYIYIQQENACVMFRKNTQLFSYRTFTKNVASQLISRFKYLGEMDVGEKRKAQLGAITYSLKQGQQRLRLSTVGDYQGKESMVIRFLYALRDEEPAYFFPEDVQIIFEKIQTERGLFLFSGHTGYGKKRVMYHLVCTVKVVVVYIEEQMSSEEVAF